MGMVYGLTDGREGKREGEKRNKTIEIVDKDK